MKKFEYLILDIIILLSPFLGKIFYKNFFLPNIKYFLISTILVSLIFLIWDFLVTNHWWYFNDKYLIGFKIFKLPIEEIIFFPFVSFSCFVIWVNLKKIFLGSFSSNFIFLFIFFILFLSLFLGVNFLRKK
jgi:lycopene cyclase domain-containing protein